MNILLPSLGFGLVTASILALAAVGFTLQAGVTNVVNLAYGSMLTTAAFLSYIAQSSFQLSLWPAVNDGTLDTIDSDHAPHTREDMVRMHEDPWTGPFGSPQYEYMLSVILTDVHAGKLSLATAIRVMSENPARIIGQYPRKGAIQVGTDADLVLVDLDCELTPTDEATYTKCKWTPYRGWKLVGAPVLTMLRGQVIAVDGKVVGKPGYGRYVPGVPQVPISTRDVRSPGLAFAPAPTREREAAPA